MPDYKDLLEKTIQLPGNLAVVHDKQYAYLCMFLTSVFCTQAYVDAQLLQKAARCLAHYQEEDENKKSVLLGIYIYLAKKNYSGTLTLPGDKILLNLFHENLQIKSLSDINTDLIKKCYSALDLFSDWVFNHREFKEADELYKAFPYDMKVVIKSPLITEEKKVEGCLSLVSNWLSGLRI